MLAVCARGSRIGVPLAVVSPARILCWCAVVIVGCGYTWVRPDAGGPVSTLRVGEVIDTSSEGDLGVHVVRELRRRIAGRERPRIDPRAPYVFEGRIAVRSDRPVAFANDALSATWRTEVELDARLVDRDARTIWSPGRLVRTATWFRGATPVDSRSARRKALEDAAARVTADCVEHMLAAASVGVPP